MHKQVSSRLSDGGSPGKLAQYTAIIADKGLNIPFRCRPERSFPGPRRSLPRELRGPLAGS